MMPTVTLTLADFDMMRNRIKVLEQSIEEADKNLRLLYGVNLDELSHNADIARTNASRAEPP